jgi:hypothetical protein
LTPSRHVAAFIAAAGQTFSVSAIEANRLAARFRTLSRGYAIPGMRDYDHVVGAVD